MGLCLAQIYKNLKAFKILRITDGEVQRKQYFLLCIANVTLIFLNNIE